MRKFLLTAALLCACTFTLQSCLDGDNDKATATCAYFAVPDSIGLTDPADSAFILPICDALASKTMALVGTESEFTESAESENQMVDYAIYKCHQQADAKYKALVTASTGAQLRSVIRTNTNDSICVDSLDEFTVRFALYSSAAMNSNMILIQRYTKNY